MYPYLAPHGRGLRTGGPLPTGPGAQSIRAYANLIDGCERGLRDRFNGGGMEEERCRGF